MEDENLPEEEKFNQRHKQEKKELQAEILQIRHSSKNDKKKKKESVAKIAQLEADLQQRHERERKEFHETQSSSQVDEVTDGVDRLTSTDTNEDTIEESSGNTRGKKISKAQKRREKKEQQAKEREELIKAAEIENLQGPRHVETQTIKRLLAERELAIREIPSDGNCLYAAINHQLSCSGEKYSVADLRKLTADHMRESRDNFLPFLSNHDTGDPFSEEEYDQYCNKIENTTEWGGHLEIQALSNVLRRPIEVVQGNSPSIISGEEHHQTKVILTYHRHAFGLGEHYNSTVPISEVKPETDEES